MWQISSEYIGHLNDLMHKINNTLTNLNLV
jgi:hypothetical protein